MEGTVTILKRGIGMSGQNIFDNDIFFDGYKKLREREKNANVLFEIPALFAILPDLNGKKILDLGCGYGEHCMEFIAKGASEVTGIDISAKMLEVAMNENSDPSITYLNMPMEDLDKLEGSYDLVVSSLAIHYIEDFKGLVKSVYNKLRSGGMFVFSQEHPLNTTYGNCDFPRWTVDETGNKIYCNLADYGIEGKRDTTWFVDDVIIYHRTFSTIINTLAEEGFVVEKLEEPTPDEEILKKYPDYCDLFHRPDFLIVRAAKR